MIDIGPPNLGGPISLILPYIRLAGEITSCYEQRTHSTKTTSLHAIGEISDHVLPKPVLNV